MTDDASIPSHDYGDGPNFDITPEWCEQNNLTLQHLPDTKLDGLDPKWWPLAFPPAPDKDDDLEDIHKGNGQMLLAWYENGASGKIDWNADDAVALDQCTKVADQYFGDHARAVGWAHFVFSQVRGRPSVP